MKFLLLFLAQIARINSEFLVDYVIESFHEPPRGIFRINGDVTEADIETEDGTTFRCDGENFLTVQPARRTATRREINVHSVTGATHLSFWYKILAPSSTSDTAVTIGSSRRKIQTVLSLWDTDFRIPNTTSTSGSLEQSEVNREQWTAVTAVGDISVNEWKHVMVGIDDFMPKDPAFSDNKNGNNGQLDLDRIEDWMIRFDFLDDQPCQGHISMRQLSFHGDGDLISSALRSRSYAEAEYHNLIKRRVHVSPLSENNTLEHLKGDGEFEIQFLAEQTEPWGGFVQYLIFPPGRSYYNLSRVEAIEMDYQVLAPAYPAGRAHFRLMLFDGEGCRSDCRDLPNLEAYYSFHYILDEAEFQNRSITLELQGDGRSNSSFWRTGWIGQERNNVLDKEHIKGFGFEISLNSQGSIGSMVSGDFIVKNFHTSLYYETAVEMKEGIVQEPELRIVNLRDSDLERLEFINLDKCERLCLERPDCNFGFSTDYGKDCYLGEAVSPGQVSVANTTFGLESTSAFWKDTLESRGEVCDVCSCDPIGRAINCRGLNLVLPPRAMANWTWEPLSLDLRDNPRMTIIGQRAFSGFYSLTHIYFPANISYVSPRSIDFLPELRTIDFETVDTRRITNVVSERNERFADKCCSKTHLSVSEDYPLQQLGFCDMKADTLGEDIEFEPFVQYVGSELDIITASSSIFAEAAESADKCGAICSVRADCFYFTFDGRLGASTKICYHYKSIKSQFLNCCNSGHYQDEEQTIPGWISGRVPRTRCIENDARVYVDSQMTTDLKESNGFKTSYQIRLGAKPRRGSVWVTPTILSSTKLNLSFSPTSIALYDDTPVVILVYVEGRFSEEINDQSILVSNVVQACDAAFSTTSSCGAEEHLQLLVDFASPSKAGEDHYLLFVSCFSVLTILVLLSFLFHTDRRRRKILHSWKIDASSVEFGDKDVVGHGKFGPVVKACYSGTQIVVKRMLPVDDEANSIQSTGISLPEGRVNTPFPIDDARRKHWMKKLEPETDTKKLLSVFLSEIHHLFQLRHSCVVAIMGVICSKKDLLLAIEYMEHGSLRDVLRNETFPLNGELVLTILQDITQGLRFLHSVSPKVLHGDLKASNCLVDRRFRVKLSDFGLGRRYVSGAIGSPLWMAPELLNGTAASSCESDIFSFGIVLYEIYSRREPYDGENSIFVLEQVSDPIVQKRPPYRDYCGTSLCKLTKACLSHLPGDRPNAHEVEEFFNTATSESVEPTVKSFSAQPRKHHSSERILYDIFPSHVADALRENREVETEDHSMVTIFFSDIVDYTHYSQSMEPRKVAQMLDRLYTAFDDLSDTHGVMKVETIGDSWMGVTNLSGLQNTDHVARVARFAFAAVKAAGNTLIDEDNPDLGNVVIRVGFHSGPCVADVVGTRNPRYCLFGDTVNTASRMESNSVANLVHCSETSALFLQEQDPSIEIISRGKIEIKGKGLMSTYFVHPKASTESFPEQSLAQTQLCSREGQKLNDNTHSSVHI